MYKLAIAMICALALSCEMRSRFSGGAEENDMHSEIILNSTLFTDSTEFFTEYPALVKGENAGLMIHITLLSSYKPCSDGEVTLEFGNIKAYATATKEPGIFSVSIQPREQGQQLMQISLKRGNRTEQVTDSVRVFQSGEDVHKSLVEQNDPSVVAYSKEQAWNADFMVQQVISQPFSSVIPASGEMLPVPGEKQHVVARSNGIVLFASKNLIQGSRVAKGQLLFTLSGQDLASDNITVQHAEALIRFQQSKSELERHSRLHAEKIVSDKQFYETLARYKTDSAFYYVMSSSVSSKGLEIYAPLSGYLHELNIAEGQFVETGDQLATVSDNQVMLLRADVPQQYFSHLNLIKTAHFRPAYSSRIYTLEELRGRLLARGASVAENNHYMPVYFEVRNDGSLLEGAFAEFYLITLNSTLSSVIPLTSIIEEQGSAYVYVQKQGAGFTKRAVTLGESDGLNTVITSGLSAGERVVTRGALLLKAASMSSAMPAHAHEH
jgi:RND family efflux transporter MFP subunit